MNIAQQAWPTPWRAVLTHAVRQNAVFATLVSEYLPRVLVKDSAAILGDAAHVVSPMTGRGFSTGVEDAYLLASLLGRVASTKDARDALIRYEEECLPVAQDLVRESMRWSDAYVRVHGGC